MTGANADERFTHRPSETGAVAAPCWLLLAVEVTGRSLRIKLEKGIEKVAKDLLAHKGQALVVSGSNDVNVQLMVNAINVSYRSERYNHQLGNYPEDRTGI